MFKTTDYELICGDALQALSQIPCNSVDVCITSPPYWGHREYEAPGIGLEQSHEEYMNSLCEIFGEVRRVLKPEGSMWLNLGDTYRSKSLMGIPWRMAIKLTDEYNWILRNDIIWNKIKGGMDNSKDKLSNIHEHVFHFVKQKKYFYNLEEVRTKPRKADIKGKKVISATGVSGTRYKRQIELSTCLKSEEKANALKALEATLADVKNEVISDFRMVIRGQQRTTHSDSAKVSGRAKEVRDNGFYFLKYHPKGSKPSDVWEILPEDRHRVDKHSAPYPEELCIIPILTSCPEKGVVLDPFCGTGTTLAVAKALGRKSIGIDVSEYYLDLCRSRLEEKVMKCS